MASDPECSIQDPNHICKGRGGKEITAGNGVQCFENARRQTGAEAEAVAA